MLALLPADSLKPERLEHCLSSSQPDTAPNIYCYDRSERYILCRVGRDAYQAIPGFDPRGSAYRFWQDPLTASEVIAALQDGGTHQVRLGVSKWEYKWIRRLKVCMEDPNVSVLLNESLYDKHKPTLMRRLYDLSRLLPAEALFVEKPEPEQEPEPSVRELSDQELSVQFSEREKLLLLVALRWAWANHTEINQKFRSPYHSTMIHVRGSDYRGTTAGEFFNLSRRFGIKFTGTDASDVAAS